jgi:hypothetical protein
VADLYGRLLARVTNTPAPRMRAEDAVQAVLELHKPREGRCTECVEYCECPDEHVCTHGNVAWPCSTIRAVARALGVTIIEGECAVNEDNREQPDAADRLLDSILREDPKPPTHVGLLCRALPCVCDPGSGHKHPDWVAYEQRTRASEAGQ